MNAKELRETGDNSYSKRSSLMSLWQEMAENFYPERADFTYQRTLGYDFAGDLMTSFPILCRRDLGDQLGSMLRPTAKEWAHMAPPFEDMEDNEVRRWLEYATTVQRKAMYDPVTLFTEATKQGDHDFATFGQCAIQIRLNRKRSALLYRCHHLRDMTWIENEEGKMGLIFRKWKPTARDLQRLFGSKVHSKVDSLLKRNKPFEEIECMHIIAEADLYDGSARGRPYFSIHYDCDNMHVMEEVPIWNQEYAIPQWEKVSGSQFAYSPAVVAALPDARLLQSMTYTLLEAGEKASSPPMIATKDVVKSDVDIQAGGLTWVDRDYDERLGEALRALNIDTKGMPIGRDMQNDCRMILQQAFYLNKLKPFMPSQDPQMTAFQAGQIVAQYIRDALPIFEPMEMGYNGKICEITFDVLFRNNAFGPMDMIPRQLRGQQVAWRFESPLHDAIDQQKGHKFLEMNQLIAQAVAMDPNAVMIPDWGGALREALEGIGTPAKWVRPSSEVDAMIKQKAEQQASMTGLDAAKTGSEVVKNLADAAGTAGSIGGAPAQQMA